MKRVVTIKTRRDCYGIEDAHDDAITIGDLIEILQRYDEDDKVILSNDGGYTYGYIGESSFDVVTFETREEEERRETMENIECDLDDLKERYKNPDEDDEPMTEEEYNEERADIFSTYGVTEDEYKEYKRKH